MYPVFTADMKVVFVYNIGARKQIVVIILYRTVSFR